MNGPHTKSSRSVSPQAFCFRAGQSGPQGRGCYFENSDGAQVPSYQSAGIETEQAPEYTEGLHYCGHYGDFSSLALGQGIGQISYAASQGVSYMMRMPFMRKVSVVLSLIAVFSIAFHAGKWWFKEPPEELITSAIASVPLPITTLYKKEDQQEFLEDCY